MNREMTLLERLHQFKEVRAWVDGYFTAMQENGVYLSDVKYRELTSEEKNRVAIMAVKRLGGEPKYIFDIYKHETAVPEL